MANMRAKSRRGGVAIIEAAIVFPLLILLTLALIEYGWMFMKIEQTNNAARHGARKAVLPDATIQGVTDEVIALMADAGLAAGQYYIYVVPGNVETVPSGDPITVTVKVPYENIRLTTFPLLPAPGDLNASVSMAKEGP